MSLTVPSSKDEPATRAGIFVLDKPKGISSAMALREVQMRLSRGVDPVLEGDLGKRSRRDKVKLGHAGTLDPLATGILVVLVGPATRLARFAEAGAKEYSGILRLGVRTSTDDAEGEILEERPVSCSPERVIAASRSFVGNIQQMPPAVSALKVAGERAYDLVRRGEVPQLAARSVRVDCFELQPILSENAPEQAGPICDYRYRVRCGPGTYIRALARDLGQLFGCGGHIRELRRSVSAPFTEADLCRMETLSWQSLRPWGDLFPSMPRVEVDSDCARLLQQGNPLAYRLLKERFQNEGLSALMDAPQLAYYCSQEPRVQGLLENVGGDWRIAVNLGLAASPCASA